MAISERSIDDQPEFQVWGKDMTKSVKYHLKIGTAETEGSCPTEGSLQELWLTLSSTTGPDSLQMGTKLSGKYTIFEGEHSIVDKMAIVVETDDGAYKRCCTPQYLTSETELWKLSKCFYEPTEWFCQYTPPAVDQFIALPSSMATVVVDPNGVPIDRNPTPLLTP